MNPCPYKASTSLFRLYHLYGAKREREREGGERTLVDCLPPPCTQMHGWHEEEEEEEEEEDEEEEEEGVKEREALVVVLGPQDAEDITWIKQGRRSLLHSQLSIHPTKNNISTHRPLR